MCRNILVVILISAIANKVIQANSVGLNGSFANESNKLQDTVNRINESLIQHYRTIKGYTDEALTNRLILDVDDQVYAIAAEQNTAFVEKMAKKHEEVSALGPKFSHCAQIVAWKLILQEVAVATKACTVPAEEFLVEYGLQTNDYIKTSVSVSQNAHDRVFDCLPETDEPTNDEVNDALRCMNTEQVGAQNSLNKLEQLLVSNQYDNEMRVETLVSEARECVGKANERALIQSGEVIDKIDMCIAEKVKSSLDQKVTMEDLQNVIDEANTTLTVEYELTSDYLNDLMDSEFIEDAITETKEMIRGANATIVQMSNSTFKIIDDVEAAGIYANCLVGVREKAQDIMDQAVTHLPQCVFPLEDVEREFHEDLLSVSSMLESEKQSAQNNILSCVPSGGDPSEEDISSAIHCVDTESLKAQNLFLALAQQLTSLDEDTVNKVDLMTYDARRCVDISTHVAGDQTGYLRFLLDQCMTNVDASSSTDNPTTRSTVDEWHFKVTEDDLQNSLDRANASLEHRYTIIEDEIYYAFNNEVLSQAVLETKVKIMNSGEPLIELSKQLGAKISETETKNLTECVGNIREISLAILEDAVDAIRACAAPIEEFANGYEEQVLASVKQYGHVKETLIKNVFDCVPSDSVPSTGEIDDALKCVEFETVRGLQSISLQDQILRANQERSDNRAMTFSADAETCVDEKVSEASEDLRQLIQDIDDCVLTLLYPGF